LKLLMMPFVKRISDIFKSFGTLYKLNITGHIFGFYKYSIHFVGHVQCILRVLCVDQLRGTSHFCAIKFINAGSNQQNGVIHMIQVNITGINIKMLKFSISI
jgi:hypothetical protein